MFQTIQVIIGVMQVSRYRIKSDLTPVLLRNTYGFLIAS